MTREEFEQFVRAVENLTRSDLMNLQGFGARTSIG
jgi:hypothetical protein